MVLSGGSVECRCCRRQPGPPEATPARGSSRGATLQGHDPLPPSCSSASEKARTGRNRDVACHGFSGQTRAMSMSAGPSRSVRTDVLKCGGRPRLADYNPVVRVLPRRRGADGGRPGPHAGHRHPRAGLRRCAPDELRRFRDARAQRHLRHQRPGRDAARALGWDLKRLAASVVIAAQHLGCRQRGRARRPRPARAYRERDGRLFVDARARRLVRPIDVQRYEDRTGDPKVMAEARASAWPSASPRRSARTVPDHLFPKLVELQGTEHRSGRAAADLPSDEKLAPGCASGFAEPLARYRESLPEHVRAVRPLPATATWRSRWSASAASARCAR